MAPICNLIVDSCCDLPFSVVDRPGVTLLKYPYLTDGVEAFDDMYATGSAHEFFESMRRGAIVTTAQIPMPAMIEAFTDALEGGVPTVYLCFSSGLSGNYETARMLADQLSAEHPDGELHVVDTKLGSSALGFLVYEALRQREAGLSARELVEWAEEARYFVNSMFMVDNLDALKRGGRVPGSVAYASAKLDVKPMLSFDLEGRLSLVGVARGRKKAIRQLAEHFSRNFVDTGLTQNVVLASSDAHRDLERLQELLERECERLLFLETEIGPVVGSHTGPDMAAVIFWGRDRREDLSVADRIARRVKTKKEGAEDEAR